MDGVTKINRDTVKKALMHQMDLYKDDPGAFLDELSHLITDFHDYQMLARQVSRGRITE